MGFVVVTCLSTIPVTKVCAHLNYRPVVVFVYVTRVVFDNGTLVAMQAVLQC